MALQGSLGHLGLADVLQTALAGQSGGNLTMLRGAERAVVHVAEDGLYLLEPDVLDPDDVLSAFEARGVLSRAVLSKAQEQGAKGLALLDALVADGHLSEGDLMEVVAGAAEDMILDLLTWDEGTFRFEENAPMPARPSLVGRVPVDRGGVLLRAAQRIDERQAIARAVGPHACLFLRLDAPPPGPESPSDPVAAVHAALDGRATVEEIGHRLGIGRFAALKAAAALVEAGAARPATPQELSIAAASRMSSRQHRVARQLALQWAEADALDPKPLETLATLGAARERLAEEVSALTLLGHRLLQRGEHETAQQAFRKALERLPGDVPALEGLRAAADAAGDASAWSAVTLSLAGAVLEDEDAARAAALAGEVLERTPSDVSALKLRARAFALAKDRDGVLITAESLLGVIGRRARRRVEREAAQYCRDVVALMAPERSDLLRSLRAAAEVRQVSRRGVALVGALLAAAAAAGVYFWPVGAGSLLSQARAAADGGDTGQAIELVAQLIERFPDSQEAQEAFALQAQLTPPPARTPARNAARSALPAKELVSVLTGALRSLPAPEALPPLEQHAQVLRGQPLRDPLPPEVVRALTEALGRLAQEARRRVDALALTRDAATRLAEKPEALRDVHQRAVEAKTPGFAEAWRPVLPVLSTLVQAARTEGLVRVLREAEQALQQHSRALTAYDGDLAEVRSRLVWLEVEAAHAACREQAPRLLVAGELEQADSLYRDLEQRLAGLAGDPSLAWVAESARKRGLPDFARERRGMLADIRRGIEAGKAAEAAGNLEAAAAAYGELAKRFYQVRFDALVRLPVEVTSLPAGARVLVNGEPVGVTPLRVHVPFGSPSTLTVEAPGFAPSVHMLQKGGEPRPTVRLTARLKPLQRWEARVDGALEAGVLEVDGGVVTADRSGRVTLFAAASGAVRWARHLKSLEGVRGRPAAVPGAVVVAFVDGRIVTLDVRDGNVIADLAGARTLGDVAALGDAAAVATVAPSVTGYAHGKRVFEVALPAAPSTSVVTAHGAFWVGTASGSLVRIDPQTGERRVLPLPGGQSGVAGLSGTASGLLAALSDGRVIALAPSGALRWTASNLGDLAGPAVETAGCVAVADRIGRVQLLDAATGAPRGGATTGKPLQGGLVVVGTRVAAGLGDGRLWILDPASASVLVDAVLSSLGLLEPTSLADGDLLVATREGRLLRLPVPAAAAPAPAPAAPSGTGDPAVER